MNGQRISRIAIVALCAIVPAAAQAAPPTFAAKYTYESNVTDRKLGSTVTIAGDLNGDGFGDLAASANGGAYAFYGKSGGPFVTAPWTGSGYGSTPAAVGDVNGDGYQDLVTFDISTPSSAGHVYLFAGSSSGLGSSPISTIVGPADSSGWGAATGVGDVNGDGYADVIIAAPKYVEDGQSRGRVWLYPGGASGLSTDPVLVGHELGHTLGLTHLGSLAITAGDVNGDNYSDIGLVADRGGSVKVIMVFPGSTTGPGATPTWADSTAFTTLRYCRGPADFNGDGYSDVLMVGDSTSFLYRGAATGKTRETMQARCELLGDINGDGRSDVVSRAESLYCACGDPFCFIKYLRCGYLPGELKLYLGGPSTMMSFVNTFGNNNDSPGHEAGDVDGDGYGDTVAGYSFYSNGQSNEGRIDVYSWKPPATSPPQKPEGYIPGNPMSMHGALDIDGDALGDLVVSAPDLALSEDPQGHVSVILGSLGGSVAGPSFNLLGAGPYSSFGASVAGEGDVNGDGYADLVVGAPRSSNGEPEEGSAWLYLGGTARDSLPDWTVEANLPFAHLGATVACAGDVNGDGYADVLVSAPGGFPAAPRDALLPDDAHAQLYLGSSAGPQPLPWWVATGSSAAGFAKALAGAGDLNGDGYSDVAIGVPGANQVQIFHGSSGGLPAAPTLTLEGTGGFGAVIASAGDVNGDGFGDLLVGSPLLGFEAPSGRATLFLGSPVGLPPLPVWSVDGAMGDALGSALAAGDLNDDGFSDVVVGSPGHDFDFGEVRIYVGSVAGLAQDTTIAGDAPGSRLGASVACSDVNGDGFVDAVLGAPGDGYLGTGLGSWMELDGGGGLARSYRPQQRRPIGSAPVNLLGSSGATGFRIRALGFGATGRGRVRLEWQLHAPGEAWGALQHGPWLDSGAPQSVIGSAVSLESLVTGLAVSTPYAWRARVATSGPDVYRNSRWFSMPGNGRDEADIRTGTVVLDVPRGTPATTGRLFSAVRPNPTASLVRVDLELSGAERVVLDVFDVGGRQVRRITSESGATTRQLTWDLRDDRGRPAGAGLYFLRATAGRRTDQERVVVLP